jgi:hypothetical protein
MYEPGNPASLEKYSSAITLSDMEVFIFPELLYALVLANIMSPALWKWKAHSWFAGQNSLSPYRRVLRIKQFIIDHFSFNLDLDTWGLTTKEKELARFSSFISPEALAQSNALFGYEGDRYYFDIDIRRHFGLDKYDSNVIPYWKTETVEAMEAFCRKPGYATGAGECVSLSTLYASALFVAASIPLENIYLMATPLHSQNFVDINDGVITNNRRIVTRNMWYNGTELSEKARRALRHERVTVVAHNTGYIHTLYNAATMSRQAYHHFEKKLSAFLSTDIDFEIVANFLRQNSRLQKCFQISHNLGGRPRYIEAEKVYSYEHNGTFKVSDKTRPQLLSEIDEDEFYPEPIQGRLLLDEVEQRFKSRSVSITRESSIAGLRDSLKHSCFNTEEVLTDLLAFCRIEPRLPSADKAWEEEPRPIEIDPSWPRERVVEYVEGIRKENPVADLAFTAYRDLKRGPWKPFLKAALERNPVSIAGSSKLDITEAAAMLEKMPDESIYDGTRAAQPDEVWNYGCGDGLEKALCLLNIARSKRPQDASGIKGDETRVIVFSGDREFSFESKKGLALPQEADFNW